MNSTKLDLQFLELQKINYDLSCAKLSETELQENHTSSETHQNWSFASTSSAKTRKIGFSKNFYRFYLINYQSLFRDFIS
jgi:hypothetical protein